ncbi:hypothetical protein NEHOM01_0732 [Nematocida homosporus]|uniref:uncharacterized protein n=1 Tax=Nematocida homosporus TaxID=1912981 RepID=UPI0022205C91|nr:uncharacterized protein NEHOM01_0732 [Nematocida homosporus]KAI5185274.1 hypothetical protein NEHOM01_0732 [Nematocida homosporus]
MREESHGLIFSESEVILDREKQEARIIITNTSSVDYGFKIKATHPESYSVRPSTGVLEKGKEVEVLIRILAGEEQITQHKFLMQFVAGHRGLLEENLPQLFGLPGIEKVERRFAVRYHQESKKEEVHVEKEENILLVLASVFIMYYLAMLLKKMIFGG